MPRGRPWRPSGPQRPSTTAKTALGSVTEWLAGKTGSPSVTQLGPCSWPTRWKTTPASGDTLRSGELSPDPGAHGGRGLEARPGQRGRAAQSGQGSNRDQPAAGQPVPSGPRPGPDRPRTTGPPTSASGQPGSSATTPTGTGPFAQGRLHPRRRGQAARCPQTHPHRPLRRGQTTRPPRTPRRLRGRRPGGTRHRRAPATASRATRQPPPSERAAGPIPTGSRLTFRSRRSPW